MKDYLILQLFKALFSLLSPEAMEEIADKIIDVAENKAAAMADGTVKSIILSLCANIRQAFQIEDND